MALLSSALDDFKNLKYRIVLPETIVLPLSGGTDSAVAFWLLSKGLPGVRTIGVHAGKCLPEEDWFKSIGEIVYTDVHGNSNELEQLRWAKFLTMALGMQAWLASSRNKTENILGTYSLASRVATYLPIVNYFKSMIIEMARQIGVPKLIIDSSSKSDPACGRTEEFSSIAIQDLDDHLIFPNSARLTRKQEQYIDSLIKKNEFKMTLPIR